MPVNNIHPRYELMYELWQRCRDFAGGEDDVKRKRADYLPQPSGQTDKTFEQYVELADFGDYVDATLGIFTGAVFRKEVKIEYPEEWDRGAAPFKDELDDITGTGVSIQDFTRVLYQDFLKTGRAFIMLDLDPPGEFGPERPVSVRPYWSSPGAEQCTFWSNEEDSWVFVMPRLEPHGSDPFDLRLRPYWHHLYLDAAGEYRIDVYTQEEQSVPTNLTTHNIDFRQLGTRNKEGRGGAEPVLVEQFRPGFGPVPFRFVPVCMLSNNLVSRDPGRPPLLGIVNLARRYYRVGAEYAWCMHWSILKQPWASGVKASEISGDKGKGGLVFGGPGLMVLPPTGASLGIAEVNPQGYEAFERKMDSIRSEIAAIGSRTLSRDGRQREAAEALAIRLAAEHASVQAWVEQTERCVEDAARMHAYLSRRTPDRNDERVIARLNRDFVPEYVDPQRLQTLVDMLLKHTISQETFFYQLELAELPPKDEDFETWKERIEAQKEAAMELGREFMEDMEAEGEGNEGSEGSDDDEGSGTGGAPGGVPVGQNGVSRE